MERNAVDQEGTITSSTFALTVGGDAESFNKDRRLITIRPAQGQITFVQRKIFNTIIHCIQNGQRNPSDQLGETSVTYTLPFHEVREAIGFGSSRNYEYIVANLDALQRTTIELSSRGPKGRTHESASLMSYVRVDEGTQMIRFRLDAAVLGMVLLPHAYQRLTLRMQNIFQTSWQLALFEEAMAALNMDSKRTVSLPWREWAKVLSGNTEGSKTFSSFSRTLRHTITQVNALQNKVCVEAMYELMPTSGRGRSAVESLYFKVSEPSQKTLFETLDNTSEELLHGLIAYGFERLEAEEALMQYGADYLVAQLVYVQDKGAKVRSKLSYLRRAIAEDFAGHIPANTKPALGAGPQSSSPSSTTPKSARGKTKPKGDPQKDEVTKKPLSLGDLQEQARSLWQVHATRAAAAEWDDYPEEKRSKVVTAFEEWLPSHHAIAYKQYQKVGLTGPLVRSSLYLFLACEPYGFNEPSTEQVLAYALQYGLLSVSPAA